MPPRLLHSPRFLAGQRSVAGFELRAEGSRESGAHRHPAAQLIMVTRGLGVIETPAGTWVIPPGAAAWIPPDVEHVGASFGAAEGASVYVAPARCEGLPREPGVFALTPLLAALFARVATFAPESAASGAEARAVDVLLDELAGAAPLRFSLPWPRSPGLRRLAERLLAAPAEDRSQQQLARLAAVSTRTLSRRFRAETGLDLTSFRRRARLKRALELLAGGAPVTAVAIEVGYRSLSAFVQAFRAELGVTPGAYAQGARA